jgi:hypothetical protein
MNASMLWCGALAANHAPEDESVDHKLISRYQSLEVRLRHPPDVTQDGSLTKATLIIN